MFGKSARFDASRIRCTLTPQKQADDLNEGAMSDDSEPEPRALPDPPASNHISPEKPAQKRQKRTAAVKGAAEISARLQEASLEHLGLSDEECPAGADTTMQAEPDSAEEAGGSDSDLNSDDIAPVERGGKPKSKAAKGSVGKGKAAASAGGDKVGKQIKPDSTPGSGDEAPKPVKGKRTSARHAQVRPAC